MENITLTKLTNKTYTFISKDEKYYLVSYQEQLDTYVKVLKFQSFTHSTLPPKPFGLLFDGALGIQKTLKTIAPIDIRVYLNGIELREDAEKSKLITDLIVAQYKIETQSQLIPITPKSLKNIQAEEALKLNVSALLSKKLTNINSMSIKEFKLIKNLLKE